MVTVQDNAQKFVYLVKSYPEQSLADIMKMMPMSPLDLNTAIWYAEDQGWVQISKEDERPMVKIVEPPKSWKFGTDFDNFIHKLMTAFKQWEKEEKDLDEVSLLTWLYGQPPHDVLIAIAWLLESGEIVEYIINDPDYDGKGGSSDYKFYTLPQNLDKQWGKKNFKVDPTKIKSKQKNNQTLH